MNKIQEYGLKYIEKGFSVIPVAKNKKPLIVWKDYQEKRADVLDFMIWLKEYPDMQIGIVTGKISGLIVVDIDNLKMDLSWLPETTIARTGSGGLHYYYQYCEGVNNKARIKEYIDIRGDGGFVVAPPSFNEKGQYQWLNKLKPVPFPKHLFIQEIKTTYQQIDTEYEGFSEGSRNEEMTRYTGHILAKIHPSEWENIAYPLIQKANEKNSPPLSDNELRVIFQSISNKEKFNTTVRWYKTNEKKEGKDELKCNIKIKKNFLDRYTWGTRGLDTSFAIIERENFIIIGGKRSAGKTTYTFDMACKNALLGHHVLYISLEMSEELLLKSIARAYSGMTVQEEYDNDIPNNKNLAFNRKIEEIKSFERLYFRGIRRDSAANWKQIVGIINEFQELDLIVIDNLDLIEADEGEDNFERQKRITKTIMRFTTEYQVPVILIHHYRKQGGKSYGADELSGSGKIADNADYIIGVVKNDDGEAQYPDKYKTKIFLQKGRGYRDGFFRDIFFIKGTFEDEAPPIEEYDPYLNSLDKSNL